MITGQKYADLTVQEEPWYGTKYLRETVDEKKMKSWEEATLHPKLRLPCPNEFIPTDFAIVERDQGHHLGPKFPAILKETSLSRLWFLQDNEFLLPKACLSVEFVSPIAYVDPHHANLSSMFMKVFQDTLTEFAYDADIAGLGYSLVPTKYGLCLTIQGYHQKQGVLLDKIMVLMKNFAVDEARFDVLKEAHIRALKNFEMEQPHSHASYRMQALVSVSFLVAAS